MITGKDTLPLRGRFWIQIPSRLVSISHSPELQKKLLDRHDTKESQEFRLFVHSVRQATTGP